MAQGFLESKTTRIEAGSLVSILEPGTLESYPTSNIGAVRQAKFVRVGGAIVLMQWNLSDRRMHYLPHHRPLVEYATGKYSDTITKEAAKAEAQGQQVLSNKQTGEKTQLNDAGYLNLTYSEDGKLTNVAVAIDSYEYGQADPEGRQRTIGLVRGIVGEAVLPREVDFSPAAAA